MQKKGTVTIGIVGAGYACQLHGNGYRRVSGVDIRLKTICDTDAVRGKAELDRFGFEHYEPNFDAMLADPEIDVVDICTPPFLHPGMIIKAIKAGKHVICEKPLSGYFGMPDDIAPIGDTVSREKMYNKVMAEMDEIKSVVAASDRLFMYAENYVYCPTIQKAAQVIRGKKSKILFMRGEESLKGSSSAVAGQWARTGGGPLARVGCHPLSGVLWLKQQEAAARGETIGIQSVTCATAVATKVLTDDEKRHIAARPEDVEDVATMTVTFTDGTMALVIAGDVCLGGTVNYVNVYANDATLVCNITPPGAMRSYMLDENGLDNVVLGEMLPMKTGWQDVFVVDEILRGYTDEFQDFAECVLTGRKPQSDFSLAYDTTKLLYAAYWSAAEGRRIDL